VVINTIAQTLLSGDTDLSKPMTAHYRHKYGAAAPSGTTPLPFANFGKDLFVLIDEFQAIRRCSRGAAPQFQPSA
jgi:hypothetical protein